MKKRLLVFVLFLVSNHYGFSQTQETVNSRLPNFDPPSPEASALGKYIEHPVGNFTGTPKIEIPLFEIKTGRISVPITISYHGSGVKIDEIASRVGMGWVLNTGGMITRTIKDFPDEFTSHVDGYFMSHGSVSGYPLTEYGRIDFEPDVHFYNFGNKSGTLYFTSPSQPVIVNKDPIKVNGPYNGSNKFVITNDDGLIYTFETTEESETFNTSGFSFRVISSWYLTSIVDPIKGKSILFTYRTDMPNLTYDVHKSLSSANGCTTGNSNDATYHIYGTKVL
jgi:hypothetical protein